MTIRFIWAALYWVAIVLAVTLAVATAAAIAGV